MIRLTTLWIAVAAFAITALLMVTAGLLASLGMRVLLADHEQWWWPLVINGLMITGWMTPFVSVGIALRRGRVRRGILRRSPPLNPLTLN
jgi:hypothetical protein